MTPSNPPPQTSAERSARKAATRRQVSSDFLYWVHEARKIITDHFPAERNEPHNALVVSTARTLMMAESLTEIEHVLDDIRLALENPKRS